MSCCVCASVLSSTKGWKKRDKVHHTVMILYVNQQTINTVPKIWEQLNEKGKSSSSDLFSMPLVRVKKRGLACKTILLVIGGN